MSDTRPTNTYRHGPQCHTAADEIEKDREHIKTLQDIVNRSADEINALRAEITRLKEIINEKELWADIDSGLTLPKISGDR